MTSLSASIQKRFAIRRLEASLIGPFTDLIMDFPQQQDRSKAEIHILTGDNGTGKSTVLQMLANCLPGGSDSLHHKLRVPKVSSYTLQFSDGASHTYRLASIKPEDEMLITVNKQLGKYDEYPSELLRYFMADDNDHLSLALFAYSGNRTIGPSTVETLTSELPNPVSNVLDFNRLSDTSTFVTWLVSALTNIALAKNDNLADSIQLLKYQLTVKELEKVVSAITGKKVVFKIRSGIPLQITLDVDGQNLTFSQLPDGLKSIISWLGDLLMRLYRIDWTDNSISPTAQNFVLFLDEIEVHLHPAWQRKVLPAVQGLFPNAQIFISTHSPFVVGSIDGASVHRLQENGQVKEAVPSEDSYSYSYILSEIFGVTEPFGVEVTKDLDEFYAFKQQILSEQPYDERAFEALLERFRKQSREIHSIIGMELRQLTRLTSRSFV